MAVEKKNLRKSMPSHYVDVYERALLVTKYRERIKRAEKDFIENYVIFR